MNIIKYIRLLPFALVLIAFAISCEDEPEPEFFASDTTPIVLEDIAVDLILIDGSNPDNPAVTFNWNDADFNQAVVENYAVEFSITEDFTNAVVATGASGVSSVTMSMIDLNRAVGNAGLPPLVQNTIYARVVASIGSEGELPTASNVISFDVVPFFNYVFNDVYLVGNATPSGWENNLNNPPLFRDATNSNTYRYTGFFDAGGGQFKVLDNRGAWAPQWGLGSSANTLAIRPTEDDDDPPVLPVTESGYYTLTVDLAGLEYTLVPFDDSSGTDFTSITLQGSGIDGGADVSMSRLAFDSHIWYITNVTLIPGELQFSTNTGSTWAGTTEFSGVATEGSNTIPVVVEDEYEVWFNDLTGDYIMIPLNL